MKILAGRIVFMPDGEIGLGMARVFLGGGRT